MKSKLFLCGTFRLENAKGNRVELNSAKAQGLLALLATSTNGERNRTWLQSKLWSDRAPEQASGSLRQTLSYLRRVLTPNGVVLDTGRHRIALDVNELDVILTGDGEFLEGIDVKDQEFESWLTMERQKKTARPIMAHVMPALPTPRPASQWAIAILPQNKGEALSRWFEGLFSDTLSRSLREVFSAPVSVQANPKVTDHLFTISVESFAPTPEATTMRVELAHPAQQHQLWSGHCTIPGKGAPPIDHPDLLRLVNEMIERLSDYLILQGLNNDDFENPDTLCRQAIRSLFTMVPGRLIEADRKFERAYELQKRGLYLGWRAQLKAIQSIENHAVDAEALQDEARDLSARALELEPNNSMVLATLANALRRFDRDDQRSHALAQRSIQLNPANPMAWWAMSAAKAYIGDNTGSYQNAIVARKLVLLSPNRFWWDCQMFCAALPEGKLDQARNAAERCRLENPNFRPPLRYLIALYASAGQMENAHFYAEELRKLEPEFSIERLLQDKSYPASLIHQAPGLDVSKLSAMV